MKRTKKQTPVEKMVEFFMKAGLGFKYPTYEDAKKVWEDKEKAKKKDQQSS